MPAMRLTPVTSDLLILLAAAIWGFGFIAQKEAMDSVGPLTFNAVRFGIGALAIAPLRFVFPRIENGDRRSELRLLWKGGLLLGLVVMFVVHLLLSVRVRVRNKTLAFTRGAPPRAGQHG